MTFRRVVVTGSSAVAGTALRALAPQLHPKTEWLFPSSRDCDLTDWTATRDWLDAARPDGIVHLAAVSGGIGLSMKHPASLLRDNTLMGLNVLEAARRLKVRKVVMTLTTGAYPPEAPLPLREESLQAGPPHESNYGSSYAKRLMEPAIQAYREEYGLPAVGLVPNGIFGPNDNFNENDAPMLPALIRRFYESRTGTDPIVIWGDGTPLREYTYSDDVARAFLWALHEYDDGQVLNSGTTEELPIADIALMIADILGIDRNRIAFDTSKPKGVFRKNTDNSRFVAASGFRYTPFREGLEKTIAWFVEARETNPRSLRLGGKLDGHKDTVA
ncbi:MAG: NAD-dependent epimerase/dehydratase family protein [Rhodospirillum sp.]|nr:NAD-dependent epimerase/dehydratase family protein [Rhodospirillum sp.]MCF8487632.1 NAD-dependent epimerase/dehydratase family protein [Rhodospirillum sp.]MCF8499236.1 NAD-dependent epimerase/dehydratase family protein [Rhodospirillum sp.]